MKSELESIFMMLSLTDDARGNACNYVTTRVYFNDEA